MAIHAQPETTSLRTASQEPGVLPVDLRGAMRSFATGVYVATTYVDRLGGRRHDAVTINSLASVSLEPPLVSLCLRRESGFLADLLTTRSWAISVLDGAADDVARRFAAKRAARAVAIGELRASPGHRTGALVLDASSWLECVLWDTFDIGDHTMVIGEVVAAGVKRCGAPLIFLYGRYHALEAGDSCGAGARHHIDHRSTAA